MQVESYEYRNVTGGRYTLVDRRIEVEGFERQAIADGHEDGWIKYVPADEVSVIIRVGGKRYRITGRMEKL